jgi:hypothetical protein
MKPYIKNIHINDLFHLHNLDISVADENSPHIILTGKNGSGKTVLLNAIANHLDQIKEDDDFSFLKIRERVENDKKRLNTNVDSEITQAQYEKWLRNSEERCKRLYGKISVDFEDAVSLVKAYKKGDFIISFYEAARKTPISEPKNPTKPTLSYNGSSKITLTSQLLYFLSDLKIQEALARNEGQIEEANHIKAWFGRFEFILKDFFEDKDLKLEFNYKDYTFKILTNGKAFKFTELSDGFIAILDIVADLILKMQDGGNLTAEFNKPGIVLIDEVETHLHLQLQKVILPMLTTLFPNIQFIISTHSPFVLSSLPNATAYDLEHQEAIADLTNYSYQALTEGYFGVSTDSDYARRRYVELKGLLEKENLTDSEKMNARMLLEDFDKIPEASLPEIVGAYRSLTIKYADKINNLIG